MTPSYLYLTLISHWEKGQTVCPCGVTALPEAHCPSTLPAWHKAAAQCCCQSSSATLHNPLCNFIHFRAPCYQLQPLISHSINQSARELASGGNQLLSPRLGRAVQLMPRAGELLGGLCPLPHVPIVQAKRQGQGGRSRRTLLESRRRSLPSLELALS